MYELLIQNGSTVYLPPVQEEVKVTTERQISPGSIEFSFVDTGISIAEGNPVRLRMEKQVCFMVVFLKSSATEAIL